MIKKYLCVLLIFIVGLVHADDCANSVNRCHSSYFVKGALPDYNAEIECYNLIINQQGSCSEAWYEKAIDLKELGKYTDALSSINGSIKLSPSNSGYLSEKGEILKLLGRFEEAASAFSEAAKIDSNPVTDLHQKGLALNYSGKYLEAIDAYDEALKMLDLNESYNWETAIELLKDKGDAYIAVKEENKANESYSMAKELKNKMNLENVPSASSSASTNSTSSTFVAPNPCWECGVTSSAFTNSTSSTSDNSDLLYQNGRGYSNNGSTSSGANIARQSA